MTDKRRLFVEGILKGLSPEEACQRAGYVAANAGMAMRLMEEPEIREALAARGGEIWKREYALGMLCRIVEAAAADATEGKFNAQSANTALRAIDLGNKMCGCNEPDACLNDKDIKFIMGEADEYAV